MADDENPQRQPSNRDDAAAPTADEPNKGSVLAQLVDKPAVGMEVVVDLSIFKGAKYDAFKAAATM